MFKKADLYLTNPTIALTGPTGSGKTMSALRIAAGIAKAMGKRFAVIDTENGSASLYSKMFDFDTLNLVPPFTTEKYIEAINAAEKLDYCCLVTDSITHAWAGEGGLLEQKGKLDERPGSNQWTNWNPIKAKDHKFKNSFLHSTIPFFIATIRSKMEYAQTESGGKKKIEKQGMAPVQADGIEYEFSVVLDIAMNHECQVSKDRTHIFNTENIFLITEETGEKLVAWRNTGKELPPTPPKPPVNPVKPPVAAPAKSVAKPPPKPLPLDAKLNPQGYVIYPFGTQKGKFLKDIPINILEQSYDWLETNGGLQKYGKLMNAIQAWLEIARPIVPESEQPDFGPEPPENYDEPPLFDEQELIP